MVRAFVASSTMTASDTRQTLPHGTDHTATALPVHLPAAPLEILTDCQPQPSPEVHLDVRKKKKKEKKKKDDIVPQVNIKADQATIDNQITLRGRSGLSFISGAGISGLVFLLVVTIAVIVYYYNTRRQSTEKTKPYKGPPPPLTTDQYLKIWERKNESIPPHHIEYRQSNDDLDYMIDSQLPHNERWQMWKIRLNIEPLKRKYRGKVDYKQLILLDEDQVKKDVKRTVPTMEEGPRRDRFLGMVSRLMNAINGYFGKETKVEGEKLPTIEYLQGWNSVVATFILVADLDENEEENIFWSFFSLVENYQFGGMCRIGFPLSIRYDEAFKTIMRSRGSTFTEWEYVSIFSNPCYVTLFKTVVPFASVVLLWDFIFFYGLNALVVLAVAFWEHGPMEPEPEQSTWDWFMGRSTPGTNDKTQEDLGTWVTGMRGAFQLTDTGSTDTFHGGGDNQFGLAIMAKARSLLEQGILEQVDEIINVTDEQLEDDETIRELKVKEANEKRKKSKVQTKRIPAGNLRKNIITGTWRQNE